MGRITTLLDEMKACCNMHDGEDTFAEPVSPERIRDGNRRMFVSIPAGRGTC